MGTYALYKIWVGIPTEQLEKIRHPSFDEFVISRYPEPMEIGGNGLVFEPIDMHGKMIGMGVMVLKLDWVVELGSSNFFDPLISTTTKRTLKKVNETFKKLGIKFTAQIYHHIDLGG